MRAATGAVPKGKPGRSPNSITPMLCQVHDWVEAQGSAYIAMEYIRGRPSRRYTGAWMCLESSRY